MKTAFSSFFWRSIWQKERKVFFSVRIADMKRQNGWGNVRFVKNGIHSQKKKVSAGLSRGTTAAAKQSKTAEVVPLSQISARDDTRMLTGMKELDRVLGGGIVSGSLVLVGGDPGIGKSTLLLQVCQRLSASRKILYISGEESQTQIKLRANRMGSFTDHMLLLCETNLDTIRTAIERQNPELVIIDSIQTMYNEEVSSAPGSVSQVRESTCADAAGKGDGDSDLYCWTCDKGGDCGRSESAGTYGGYGTLF